MVKIGTEWCQTRIRSMTLFSFLAYEFGGEGDKARDPEKEQQSAERPGWRYREQQIRGCQSSRKENHMLVEIPEDWRTAVESVPKPPTSDGYQGFGCLIFPSCKRVS